MRFDGRKPDELRKVSITPDFVLYPEGSVLIATGETKVLCNVSIEETIPNWMLAQEIPGGWITSEYSMLPRSTHSRTPRERSLTRGRTHEIQRIVGRSLRASIDLVKLGPRTCIVDCDVLQADGGTRTAAITGGYVALVIALSDFIKSEKLSKRVINTEIAAVSVGIVDGIPILDLCYQEDFAADVDINVVMTSSGEFVEIQGTGENATFSRKEFDQMLNLAYKGIGQLIEAQRQVLNKYTNPQYQR
jgi:ribonuclease PH